MSDPGPSAVPPTDWPAPLRTLIGLIRAGLAGHAGANDEGADGAGPAGGAALDRAGWSGLRDLALLHRVAPLIAAPLAAASGAVPESVRSDVNEAARANALRTLVQIGETRRIRTALDARGIAVGVLKSWPLGLRLFGETGRRHAGDLDLLVPEARMLDAVAALGELGFLPDERTAKYRRRRRGLGNPLLISAAKDVPLTRAVTGVEVELHWRMLNYRGWPQLVDRPGALVAQQTEAGSLDVPAPATDLIFLSAHGSLHLWERLQWLVDIAALARQRGIDRLEEDMALARDLRLDRAPALALRLAGRVFASPVPPAARAVRGVDGLERWSLARLGRSHRPASMRAYQAGLRWMALRLARGSRQRLGVIEYDTLRRAKLAAIDLL